MLDQLNNFTRRKHYTNFIDFFDLNSFKQNIGNKLFVNGNIYSWDEFIQKLTWPEWKSTELYSTIIDYLLDNDNKTELVNNWPVVDVLYLRQKNNADIADKIKCLFPEKLIDIVNDIYKIKDNLRVNPDILQGDCLCQYTGIGSIKYLINNNSLENIPDGSDSSPAVLRLTNSNQMNDPLEGRVFLDYFENIANKNGSIGNRLEGDYIPSAAFISSASGSINKLSLWQEYADNAKGVCLIYDNKFLKEKLLKKEHHGEVQEINLYRMVYLREKVGKELNSKDMSKYFKLHFSQLKNEESVDFVQVSYSIDKLIDDFKKLQDSGNSKEYVKVALTCISTISYLFKRDDYKDENEFRIMTTLYPKDPRIINDFNSQNNTIMLRAYTRDHNGNLIRVRYSKVLLGPKSPDIDYIAPYIKNVDPSIAVIKSGIHFR